MSGAPYWIINKIQIKGSMHNRIPVLIWFLPSSKKKEMVIVLHPSPDRPS